MLIVVSVKYGKNAHYSLKYIDIDQFHCWRKHDIPTDCCYIRFSPVVILIDISMSLTSQIYKISYNIANAISSSSIVNDFIIISTINISINNFLLLL